MENDEWVEIELELGSWPPEDSDAALADDLCDHPCDDYWQGLPCGCTDSFRREYLDEA